MTIEYCADRKSPRFHIPISCAKLTCAFIWYICILLNFFSGKWSNRLTCYGQPKPPRLLLCLTVLAKWRFLRPVLHAEGESWKAYYLGHGPLLASIVSELCCGTFTTVRWSRVRNRNTMALAYFVSVNSSITRLQGWKSLAWWIMKHLRAQEQQIWRVNITPPVPDGHVREDDLMLKLVKGIWMTNSVALTEITSPASEAEPRCFLIVLFSLNEDWKARILRQVKRMLTKSQALWISGIQEFSQIIGVSAQGTAGVAFQPLVDASCVKCVLALRQQTEEFNIPELR